MEDEEDEYPCKACLTRFAGVEKLRTGQSVCMVCGFDVPEEKSKNTKKTSMSVQGKTVLILGGTGTVGTGAVHAFLENGANVIVVSRTSEKVDRLRFQFLGKPLRCVIGGFDTEDESAAALEGVQGILTETGQELNHVVSTLSYAKTDEKPVSEGSLELLREGLKDIEPTFCAAAVFLKLVKEKEGASYTIVNGGLRHACFRTGFWPATIKNNAMYGLTLALQKETEESKVRVNTVCIHFAVKPHNEIDKPNQWGMKPSDTYDLGPVFVKVATDSTLKAQSVCLGSNEEAIAYASS